MEIFYTKYQYCIHNKDLFRQRYPNYPITGYNFPSAVSNYNNFTIYLN